MLQTAKRDCRIAANAGVAPGSSSEDRAGRLL
jgi:hypothetical protein